jgi:DNA-binding LacI/PurR family transcriptional regulator
VTLAAGTRKRGATIYDVARLAGVSHQTVTRVLRGFEGIRPETRQRVQSALAELDYRPNMAARSLATNRSRRIGALVYELLQVGPSKTIQGASDAAREAGYVLDVVTVDPGDDDAVESAFDAMRDEDLAGILAFAPTDLLSDRILAARFSVPVLVETQADLDAAARHTSVSDQGMTQVVDYLVGLGHERFFHVSGPLTWWASRNRVEAYESALARHGLTSCGVIEGAWSAESGYAAGLALPLDTGVTAVVAANDQMALGVLRALSEQGRSVPEQTSVTGFDDMPESAYFQPPLTTVRLDYAHQGRAFMSRMLALLDGREAAAIAPATAELVVRSSAAAPGVSRVGVRES